MSCCHAFFFSSRRRHTRCALVTAVQTCALPIYLQARWRPASVLPSGLVGLDRTRELQGAAAAMVRDDLPDRYHARKRLPARDPRLAPPRSSAPPSRRSEEHTSELQSLMRISYAVFCLKKKKQHIQPHLTQTYPRSHTQTY